MTHFIKYEPKECERCKSLHICTGTSNCACFDVEISGKLLDHLSLHYEDCLCPACLKGLKNQNS